MLRIIHVLLILSVCGFAINVQAAPQLTINYALEDSFPFTEESGGVTNTTGSSLQDSGSLGDETYSSELSYGSAKISAHSFSAPTDYGISAVRSIWQDTLTVNATGFSAGFMDLTFALSGSPLATTVDSGSAYEVHIYYNLGTFYDRNGGDAGGDPLTDFTADGQGVTFGQAFDLKVELGAYMLTAGTMGGTASMTDLELILTDIKISATEGGDRIAATIDSASGTVYPVPEPASTTMVLLSAIGFFAYRRVLTR